MNSLFVERYYPYAAALLGAGAWYCLGRPFPEDASSFLTAALGFAGTLAGFLATAQAILMALPSESVMGQLKSSGYIDDLVRYLREAFYGLMGFAILNLCGFFIERGNMLPMWFRLAWIGLAILSVLVFHRLTRIILHIMRRR